MIHRRLSPLSLLICECVSVYLFCLSARIARTFQRRMRANRTTRLGNIQSQLDNKTEHSSNRHGAQYTREFRFAIHKCSLSLHRLLCRFMCVISVTQVHRSRQKFEGNISRAHIFHRIIITSVAFELNGCRLILSVTPVVQTTIDRVRKRIVHY